MYSAEQLCSVLNVNDNILFRKLFKFVEALSVLLHVSKIGAIMVITAMLLALGKNKTVSIFFQQMIIKKTCNLIKTSAVGLNRYICNTYILTKN